MTSPLYMIDNWCGVDLNELFFYVGVGLAFP